MSNGKSWTFREILPTQPGAGGDFSEPEVTSSIETISVASGTLKTSMTSFLRWSIAHARRTKEPWNTLLRCWNDNVTYTNGCVLISGIQYVHLTNLYAAVPGRKTLQPKFSIMAVEIGSDQGQTEPKIPFGH